MCDDVFIKVFEYMLSTSMVLVVFFTAMYVLREFVKQCEEEIISFIVTIGTCVILLVSFIILVSKL